MLRLSGACDRYYGDDWMPSTWRDFDWPADPEECGVCGRRSHCQCEEEVLQRVIDGKEVPW